MKTTFERLFPRFIFLPVALIFVYLEQHFEFHDDNCPSEIATCGLYVVLVFVTIKNFRQDFIKTNHIVFFCLVIFVCIQRESNLVHCVASFFLGYENYRKYDIFFHLIYALPLFVLLIKNFKTYFRCINKETVTSGISMMCVVVVSQIADQVNESKNLILLTIEEGFEFALPVFLLAFIKKMSKALKLTNATWKN